MGGLFLKELKDTFFGSITFEVNRGALLSVSEELKGGETFDGNAWDFVSSSIDLSQDNILVR